MRRGQSTTFDPLRSYSEMQLTHPMIPWPDVAAVQDATQRSTASPNDWGTVVHGAVMKASSKLGTDLRDGGLLDSALCLVPDLMVRSGHYCCAERQRADAWVIPRAQQPRGPRLCPPAVGGALAIHRSGDGPKVFDEPEG